MSVRKIINKIGQVLCRHRVIKLDEGWINRYTCQECGKKVAAGCTFTVPLS